MKISNQLKTNIRNAIFFVVGAIVTIILTKASDKVVPSDPVIVKQFTDTVKIVHEYNLPEKLGNDTVRKELENKIRNIELLNSYDKEIKARILQIQKSDGLTPNLIVTQNVNGIFNKGYTYASSSSYFTSDCPELNSKYVDIEINFLNLSITKEIAYLRVEIDKFDDPMKNEARNLILDDFYEVKEANNFIRINNDFPKGKY